MRKIQYTISLLIVALSLASCKDSYMLNIPDCNYSVRLRYDYNEENSTDKNMIDYVVRSMEEFVFDEQGVLVAINTPKRDNKGNWTSELNLQQGRYSVISIANRDTRSVIFDELTEETPKIGTTNRNDMRIKLDNAQQMDQDAKGSGEKLYYGYRTFSVLGDKIGHVRVDMIHSHLVLKIRVNWKKGDAPIEKDNYYIIVNNISSVNSLMPEYYYPAFSFQAENHNPAVDDTYESQSESVMHYILNTCYLNLNNLHHRHNTYITNDNEMWAVFTTYRIKNNTPLKLNIYHYDTVVSQSTKLLAEDIDLNAYLIEEQGVNLDHALRQEYLLSITINGDKAETKPLNIGDWEEGGKIN